MDGAINVCSLRWCCADHYCGNHYNIRSHNNLLYLNVCWDGGLAGWGDPEMSPLMDAGRPEVAK